MTQFNAFASKLRINALLCCSAVALLTACGGNVDAGADQLSATAAGVTTDAGAAAVAASGAAPDAAVEAIEAIAESAPAANTEAPPAASTEAPPAASAEAAPGASTADAAGQAEDVTTQASELAGYDSNPLPAQTGQQDAGANAPASIKQ